MKMLSLAFLLIAGGVGAQTFDPTFQPPNMSNSPDQIFQACSIQAGLPTPQQRRMGANPAPPSNFQQSVYNECLRRSGVNTEQVDLSAPTPVPMPSSETKLQQIMASCAVSVGAANPTYVKPAQKQTFDYCLWRNGVKTTTEDVNIR